MLSNQDVEYLNTGLPFFSRLNNDEQKQVVDKSIFTTYLKGQRPFESTNGCNGLILLREGQIRAYIMSSEGKEITLFRLLSSDMCIMTASCMFKNIHFTIYLEVEKKSSFYLIPTKVVDQLNQNNIEVKEYLMDLMGARFSDAMWVMEQVVFGSLSKRVASFILEQTILEKSLSLSITHDTIGRNIGTAREVVSRMLKYFENDQIIQISRGTILVIDEVKLKILAE